MVDDMIPGQDSCKDAEHCIPACRPTNNKTGYFLAGHQRPFQLRLLQKLGGFNETLAAFPAVTVGQKMGI